MCVRVRACAWVGVDEVVHAEASNHLTCCVRTIVKGSTVCDINGGTREGRGTGYRLTSVDVRKTSLTTEEAMVVISAVSNGIMVDGFLLHFLVF